MALHTPQDTHDVHSGKETRILEEHLAVVVSCFVFLLNSSYTRKRTFRYQTTASLPCRGSWGLTWSSFHGHSAKRIWGGLLK